MYHSISDDPETGVAGYYKVCTPHSRFRNQIRWLHISGYNPLALEEWGNGPTEGTPNGMKAGVTFDDGYRDNYTHALPVLEEFGYTAVIYLATSFIGDQRRIFKGRECLTWSEVREMQARGVRFGSHTVTHPVLHGLDWPVIDRELRDSRLEIEDKLQTRITSFAYPYAFPQEDSGYVARFQDALRSSGYRQCMTTIIGRNQPGADSFALKRLPVNSSDDDQLFEAKLAGAYDWLGSVQASTRQFKQWRRNLK